MNLIDISNWQAGIDLQRLFEENDLEGVIVKATQGISYTNPKFKEWADWLSSNKKPFGMYHFLDGYDAIAEAEHFYSRVQPYVGHCLLFADYEDTALQRGTAWLKEFLDEVYRLTGSKPIVYCSQSVTQEQNFNAIAQAGYKLWVAQYADYSPVYGFIENPWHSGSVAPFNGYAMQQYTSCGVLNGWKSYLDLDKFFGSVSEWQALVEEGGKVEPTPGVLKDPDATIIAEVLDGKHRNGSSREASVRSAGYDPEKVQRKVNELYAIALSCKKFTNGNEQYLDSIAKIISCL